MAAHRYWKLKIHIANDANIIAQEIEFRSTPGGADETSPSTTVTGSPGSFSAAEGPDKAINNNNGDWWQPAAPSGTATTTPAEIIIDFGAGNDKDINEISWRDHTSFHVRTPNVMSVESSDDGSTFNVEWWALWGAWATQTRVSTRPSAFSAARYWAIGNLVSQTGGADVMSAAEIDFYEGGINITSGGTAFGGPISLGNVVGRAFDNNAANYWSTAARSGRQAYIGYDFGSGNNVAPDEVRWQARADGFAGQSIVSGDLLKSTDGVSFVLAWSISGAGGWTTGAIQTFTKAEVLTSVTPNVGGVLGGTPVTIHGFGFIDATGVLFDTDPATNVVVVDDSNITCDTPAHVVGAVDVTVQRPTTDLIGEDAFTYIDVDPPTIVSLSPNEGPVSGGTSVTLTGTDLSGATGAEINGVAVTSFVVVNATTITFDTPASAIDGPVDVELLHPFGDYLLEDGFTYINVVRVTQLPALLVHLPHQAARVTQIPVLVLHVPIQGVRVTQLPALPVWLPTPIPFPAPIVPDVPLNEAWTWHTALMVSENGSEQRARLREVPRVSMAFETVIEGEQERREVFDLLFKAQKQVFPFPLYQYSTRLTASAIAGGTSLAFDATRIDARDGELLALFDPSDFTTHYVTIEDLTSGGATVSPLPMDAPAGWLVCGVTTFRTDPVIGLEMDPVTGSVALTLISTTNRAFRNPFDATTNTTYDGKVVLADRPLANESVREEFDQNTEWLDNEIGPPEPVTNWAVPFISGTRQYLARRPEGLHKWRAFLDYTKGRQGAFLVPTFRDDFPLTAVPALGAIVLRTSRIQFFDYWRNPGYRYLRIVTANGVIYRRINEVLAHYDLEGNPVELSLVLNTALGGAAGDNIISAVSFMLLCRLDSDTVRLTHGEHDTLVEIDIKGVNA